MASQSQRRLTLLLKVCGVIFFLKLLFRLLRIRSIANHQHCGWDLRTNRMKNNQQDLMLKGRYFLNKDGLYIGYNHWVPQNPNGEIVLIIHGLGEHSGRYQHLATALNIAGFEVFSMDHQGHGCSEGDRGYFPSIWNLVDDVVQFAREVVSSKDTNKLDHKCFIIGHSMGAMVSSLAALKTPELFKGVVLSGAPNGTTVLNLLPKPLRMMLPHLNKMMPKLPLFKLDDSGLSRTASVRQTYLLDPGVFHGIVSVSALQAIAEGVTYLQNHAADFALPLLVQHGTEDRLVSIQNAEEFFPKVCVADKKFIRYEGWYHEIYNECEKDCDVQVGANGLMTNRAIREATSWIQDHIESKPV